METDIELVVLLAAGVLNLFIALFVYIQNKKSITNISFSLLILSLVLWSVANYFSLRLNDKEAVFLMVNLILFFVVLQATFFYIFANNFPYQLKKRSTYNSTKLYFGIFCALTLAIASLGLFFTGYEETSDSINPSPSPLILVFILFTGISIFGGLFNLAKKRSKAKKSVKKQLNSIFIASLLLFVLIPVTNFVLPLALGNNSFISLSPIYLLIYAAIVTYSIFKHRAFNIKKIVATSVAYLLSLSTILIFFVIGVNFVSGIFLEDELSSSVQLFYLVTSLFVGVVFYPLKQFFDKITNKIFYRDHYEIQNILDELGDVIVAEIEIDDLMKNSIAVIEKYIRPSAGLSILLDENGEFYDEFALMKAIKLKEADAIEVLKMQDETIIAIDDHEDQLHGAAHTDFQKLIKYISSKNISLSIRLSTKDQVVGYMLLGPKLSGNTYTKEDIQFLNIAASELAVSIQNARRFDEIQRFNETLRLEVDRATKEMRESNRKLRELDEAKDEFITMASHQLRTPLTSVKGYVSMVMEEDAGKINKRQRDLLANAYSSAQRMVYLIGDLLNASRLKTGKFIIEAKAVNLPKIIDSEIDQLKATASTRDIKLQFKYPKNFPPVLLDENKIRQVIMNYIDNAIYYTKAKGKIVIELKSDSKKVELRVTDSGIGVPQREKHKLFTKFYRAENAKAARPDGTGLGLFMAKKVVVAQGGAIIFESVEGKGSTFGFSFPLSRVGVNSNVSKKISKSKSKKTKKSSQRRDVKAKK